MDRSERPPNPKCDEGCGLTRDIQHAVTKPERLASIAEELSSYPMTDAYMRVRAFLYLYRIGYGYHEIADALDITHEEARKTLITNGTDAEWAYR